MRASTCMPLASLHVSTAKAAIRKEYKRTYCITTPPKAPAGHDTLHTLFHIVPFRLSPSGSCVKSKGRGIPEHSQDIEDPPALTAIDWWGPPDQRRKQKVGGSPSSHRRPESSSIPELREAATRDVPVHAVQRAMTSLAPLGRTIISVLRISLIFTCSSGS